MKSKEVGARIRALMKEHRLSQRKVQEDTGINQSVLSETINGNMGYERVVDRLASVYGWSRDYLVTGALVDGLIGNYNQKLKEGECILEYQETSGNFHYNTKPDSMKPNTSGYSPICVSTIEECGNFCMRLQHRVDFSQRPYPTKEYVIEEWEKFKNGNGDDDPKEKTRPRLPVTAAAGYLQEYLTGVMAAECEQMSYIRGLTDYDFTMFVQGDSMEPKFEGGDEIACKKVVSMIEWGKAYVVSTRDGAVLKRLYDEGECIRCVSYNHEEYPDFLVNKNEILDVYRIVGVLRTH